MHPLRHALVLTVTAGFALSVLSACGDDVSPAGSSPTAAASAVGDAPAAEAFDPCKKITAAEIGAIVGFTVVMKEVPGGGCSYDPADNPRLTTISISVGVPSASGGGIESSKTGSAALIDGEPTALSGVGDAAYVVVGKGKVMGKSSFQAQSAIDVKGQLVIITLAQFGDAAKEQVTTFVTEATKLVASKI